MIGHSARARLLPGIALLFLLAGAASAQRAVEIVLDASGSMNARLADGTPRIEAARSALSSVAETLPENTRVALRAYGHQSPRQDKNCQDTELLVPFSDASDQSTVSAIEQQAAGVKAQGYTPITWVLEQAAGDFGDDLPAERAIVLISDGKETCDGDPCATARALREADVDLVIHTVGFAVDAATRGQLQCIAHAGGGTYSEAADLDALRQVLGEAAVRGGSVATARSQLPGNLTIEGANLSGHEVRSVETGEVVGSISKLGSTIRVPAGIYSVTFGPLEWKSVRVEPEGHTTLEPGILSVAGLDVNRRDVADFETGEVVASVSALKSYVALIPGTYEVRFGAAAWGPILVDAGTEVELMPAILRLAGASKARVLDSDGNEIANMSSIRSSTAVPPGRWDVWVDGEQRTIEVEAGEELDLGPGS